MLADGAVSKTIRVNKRQGTTRNFLASLRISFDVRLDVANWRTDGSRFAPMYGAHFHYGSESVLFYLFFVVRSIGFFSAEVCMCGLVN